MNPEEFDKILNDPRFQFESRMMYENFMESQGPYGNSDLVFSEGAKVCCEPPKGIWWVGCGNGSGMSLIRTSLNCRKVWCIDANSTLLRDIDPHYNPICAVLDSQPREDANWFVTSNKDFNGLHDFGHVVEDQYRLVRIRSDTVKTTTFDELASTFTISQPPNCMILDVPGSEAHIIAGASKVLEKIEYVFIKSYLPNAQEKFDIRLTERVMNEIGFQHSRTYADSTYTVWSVWFRYLPTTKWSMTCQLDNGGTIGELLFQLANAYCLSKRKGYQLRLNADVVDLTGGRSFMQPFFKTSSKVYNSYKWHKLVYEPEHTYCDQYIPPQQHIMLVGSYQNERFTEPHRLEFIRQLNFPEDIMQTIVQAVYQLSYIVKAPYQSMCIVCLDEPDDYLIDSIQKMKERGAQKFIGLSIDGKYPMRESIKHLIDVDLTEGLQFDILRLMTIRCFRYMIIGSDAVSQWGRLTLEDLSSIEAICPSFD